MEPSFNPYRKWLGIPLEEQPPNHYRLLGIAVFEDDRDVISNAADRQMAHVRTYQTGKRSELSQKILNELSTAKVCLLDPERKQAYDGQLRAELSAAQAMAAPKPVAKAAVAAPARPRPVGEQPQPVYSVANPGGEIAPLAGGGARGGLPGGGAPVARRHGRGRRRSTELTLVTWLVVGGLVVLALILVPPMFREPEPSGGGPSSVAGRDPSAPAPHPNGSARAGDGGLQSAPPVRPREERKPPSDNPTGVQKDPTERNGKVPPADPAMPPDEPTEPPDESTEPPDEPSDPPDEPTPTDHEVVPQLRDLIKPAPAMLVKRRPQPSTAEVQRARTRALADLKPQLDQARQAQQRAALARNIEQNALSDANPAVQVALLQIARELYLQQHDYESALRTIDLVGANYDIDAIADKKAIVDEAARATTAPVPLLLAADTLVDEAASAGRFDVAVATARQCRTIAARTQDRTYIQLANLRATRVENMDREYQSAQRAEKQLQENPDDSLSNFVIGRFLCVVKRDWDNGLKFLVKGNDDPHREAAEKDLAQPLEPAQQIELAESWYTLGRRRDSIFREAMYERAYHWLTRAAEQSTSADDLQRIQKRMDEINVFFRENVVSGP
jgi:phosphoribosylformylglycinamidine (FGAM) synthase PurS component